MRQKKLEVERVLLEGARDSFGRDLWGEATSWAGRIWDRGEEPTVRGRTRMEREPLDPSPKVFPSAVARATGKLLRWDDKSRNSARSASPWAARAGGIELLASDDDQALQGATGHGTSGLTHALGQGFGVVIAPADIGKEQKGMSMKGPVAAQLFVHGSGQRNQSVFAAFAMADEQFVFLAPDVVNGQAEAFA